MRDYHLPSSTWPDGWVGCLGNEPTHIMFVEHLVYVFREIKRVLRSDGVFFCNINDSYNTSPAGNKPGWEGQKASKLSGVKEGSRYLETRDEYRRGSLTKRKISGTKNKDMFLIPERLAIGLQDDGWYVRSKIAWTKNSILPESIRDRPTVAWEYIWMLTKSPKYFWDKEAALEPYTGSTSNPGSSVHTGRNCRNVWLMNPDHHTNLEHHATFPKELPTRAIKAATSEKGCCPTCRTPWVRIIEKGEPDKEHQTLCGADSTGGYSGQATKDYKNAKAQDPSATKARILAGLVSKRTVGWKPTCSCPPHEPVPCLVLDPFSGAGTTILAAKELGRDAVGIELNPEYVDLSKNRIGGEIWDTWMW